MCPRDSQAAQGGTVFVKADSGPHPASALAELCDLGQVTSFSVPHL